MFREDLPRLIPLGSLFLIFATLMLPNGEPYVNPFGVQEA
jgi:hypothetical protein